jgi:hypothetical protein
MSKQYVKLGLSDMYAIKHALQFKVEKRKIILAFAKVAAGLNKNITEVEKIEKDINHEESLVKRFEENIKDFKRKNRIK